MIKQLNKMIAIIKHLKKADKELSIVRNHTAGLSGFESKLRELIIEAEQLKVKEND